MIGKMVLPVSLALFLLGCSSNDVKDFIDETKAKYFQESDAGVKDESGTVVPGIEDNIPVDGQEEEFLRLHNEARMALATMPALQWSTPLAEDAKAYANTLALSGKWEHDPKNHGGYANGPYGENLYTSTLKPTLADAAEAWIKEKRYYTYGKIGDASTCETGQMCGHYTQIIWKDTSEVGCAISKYRKGNYKDWYLVVCKYKTPGNYIGQTPY